MALAAERRLSYDKNLLREAEAAMQEQFQLRPNRSGFASSSQARLAHPSQPPTSSDHVRFSEKATPSDNGPGLPFWRTTRGKALIAILVLVIIGTVVGAAVGTTVHKSQSVTVSTSQSPTATKNPMGSVASLLGPTSGGTVSNFVGSSTPRPTPRLG
ncbi:hypothetical protein M378DRAFT_11556 [Amanita muscaria Koide BX008]|uniref:Uncharacterized protein n=1 Tax=Amanita muscaria (strain Koide BX008) TaxID=946122 RepID=A0A0C2X511_AMAMK|nr:hypothetical protein M378DRAFT_11556 [Amanita muscaria Koide BX008]